MAEITGGELLVRCLAAEGVRLVFGLPCPEVFRCSRGWRASGFDS